MFFIHSVYNKTIIRFVFCDVQNKQGLGKGYQPQPSASADNPYLDLDYSQKPHPIIVYCLNVFFCCFTENVHGDQLKNHLIHLGVISSYSSLCMYI